MIKMKKLLALCLSVLMVISAMPMISWASEPIVFQWKAGYNKGKTTADNAEVGEIAEGYEPVPYTIINSDWTPHALYAKNPNAIGQDKGYSIRIDNKSVLLDFAVTVHEAAVYGLEVGARIDAESKSTTDTLYVYVDGEEAGTINVDSKTMTSYYVTSIAMSPETPVHISFWNKDDNGGLAGRILMEDCVLTSVAPLELEGVSIDEGDTVDRSTDVITLDYSRELDEEELPNATFMLLDSSSNALALTAELDESDASKLNIILCESLAYEETYTLSFSGITDSVGYVTEEETLSFNVSAEAEDESADNAAVSLEADIEGTTFTLNGRVTGSKGQGMAGRRVAVSVTSPLGNDTALIEMVTSGEDGAFTLTYTLSEEDEENGGMYTFTANAEYAAEDAVATARYISETDKINLLGTLESKTLASEVESFFAQGTNAVDLGADLASLDAFGENKSLFYERLANATYKNEAGQYDIKVFGNVWETAYALEDINLSDDDAVTQSYLENADFAASIDLDVDKYESLSEQKAALIAAVTALERQATAIDFGKAVNSLINTALLAEKGKTNLSLTLSGASVYVGQVAKVALTLASKASDVVAYTIEVTCPTEDAAEVVNLEGLKGCEVVKTTSGSVASFSVTGASGELSKLGTLTYSSASEAEIAFTVKGTATYDIDDVLFDCTIAEAEVDVTVRKNSSKGSTGGRTSYYTPVQAAPQTSVVIPGETENNQEDFTDIAGVSWAEESIMNLYKKGIISEAADGKFRPNDSVTRAEFVKMLTMALRITDESKSVTLGDVSESDWYYPYVSAAVNYGLVLGDEYGNFRPNDRITRQDICVIISRVMDKLGYDELADEGTQFEDDYMISGYAKRAVYRMRFHEIVNGTGDGNFAPLSDATRAATAKILDTFMREAKI